MTRSRWSRGVIAAVLVAPVLSILVASRQCDRGAPTHGTGSATISTPSRPPPTGSSGPHLDARSDAIRGPRRVSPEVRDDLARRIREAIERPRSAPVEAPHAPDDAGSAIQQALAGLKDVVPLTQNCHALHPDGMPAAVAVTMKLATDPELGTVIDLDTITDRDGNPLPPKVDDCLRDLFDELALPGFGDEPQQLSLRYTLTSRTD